MHYISQSDEKKMGKTVSPLKGIREGLEDMLNIEQLKELLGGFRGMKNNNKRKAEDDESNDSGNDMMSMLPLIQQMQNKGGNNNGNNGGMFDGIDPTMLMMMMNSGKKNNNNLGQLFFMLSMAKLQNNNNNNNNNSGNTQQTNSNVSNDVITSLYKELQNVMNQQQQKQPIDPMTMLMINSINKSNQTPPPANQNFEIILDKFNTMMTNNQAQQFTMALQQSNDRFERGMEMIAGALNRERPEEKLMSNFNLFRELAGDKRQKSVQEMEFDIKRQELVLKHQDRNDLLAAEERQVVREDAKTSRLMETATTVLDKVFTNGVGNLVKDVMSAKSESGNSGQRKGRRGRKEAPVEEFDPSYLDDLNEE